MPLLYYRDQRNKDEWQPGRITRSQDAIALNQKTKASVIANIKQVVKDQNDPALPDGFARLARSVS